MKKLYYPNCSELIADFNTKNPEEFFDLVNKLGKKHKWHFDPPLSIKVLKQMLYEARLYSLGTPYETIDKTSIEILDLKGNHTNIQFGSNGYDDSLGFRFDSGCNHVDDTQFEFFELAVQECQAEMKSYDGGSLNHFEEWQSNKT